MKLDIKTAMASASLCILVVASGCSHKADETPPAGTATLSATPEEIKAVQQNERMPPGLKQQWLNSHGVR